MKNRVRFVHFFVLDKEYVVDMVSCVDVSSTRLRICFDSGGDVPSISSFFSSVGEKILFSIGVDDGSFYIKSFFGLYRKSVIKNGFYCVEFKILGD